MTTRSLRSAHQRARLEHGPSWANRYALAPMTNKQSNDDGTMSDDEYGWLLARARGGFGLVTTCAAYVVDTGRTWHGQLGIASAVHLPGLTRLADGLRAAGAASAVQLHHGGRRANPPQPGTPSAPFDDPETGARAMSLEDVHQMVEDYVAAAVRAEHAGFDGVALHGAHGYLLAQFLDIRNQRRDRYGGALDNRMRALVEVLEGVRSATSSHFQLGVRLEAEASGTTLAEGRETARQVLASGVVDYVDMSLHDVFARPRDHDFDGLLIDAVVDLPRGGTLLSVAGRVLTAADASWCLAKGADVVTVGTGAILHHDFAARALTDSGFAARPQPVSPEVLTSEFVGPAFVDYLTDGWPELVQDAGARPR